MILFSFTFNRLFVSTEYRKIRGEYKKMKKMIVEIIERGQYFRCDNNA